MRISQLPRDRLHSRSRALTQILAVRHRSFVPTASDNLQECDRADMHAERELNANGATWMDEMDGEAK